MSEALRSTALDEEEQSSRIGSSLPQPRGSDSGAGQAAARFRSDRRREALRARMEARMEATDGNRPQHALTSSIGEVVDLQEVREVAH